MQHAPPYSRGCCYSRTLSPRRRGTELRPFQIPKASFPSPVISAPDTPIVRLKPLMLRTRCDTHLHRTRSFKARSAILQRVYAPPRCMIPSPATHRLCQLDSPSANACCLHADICRYSRRDSVMITPGAIHLPLFLSVELLYSTSC